MNATDTARIHYYGRNVFHDTAVALANTAAAFEVSFIGKSLTADLKATAADVRLQLYVNGAAVAQQLTLSVDRKTHTLVSDCNPDERTTVRAVKVNSADKGKIELYGLDSDGVFVTPAEKPTLKLEVYGDSITCGYGVNGLSESNAANEDGTVTYAYRTAEHFGAQLYVQACSGISAAVPVTSWGFAARQYMGAMYDWASPRVVSEKWDASRYCADVIIVSLGTNDAVALDNGEGTKQQFIERYTQFVRNLRAKNQTAPIVLCYGMMGRSPAVDSGLRQIADESGIGNVRYFPMNEVSRTALNGHPDKAGHADGAGQLIAFLERTYFF